MPRLASEVANADQLAQPNAQLAVAHQVRFLAHNVWQAGVALVAVGLTACLGSSLSAERGPGPAKFELACGFCVLRPR
jgi:hypothetical protein